MKKSLLSLCSIFGAAALLSSCSEEVREPSVADGNVTFSVSVPAAVKSRAFGDGTTAQNNVVYYVYDAANGDAAEPVLTGSVPMTDLNGTVTLGLAVDHTYDVIFLATAQGAPYTYGTTTRAMTVDYDAVANSSEDLDAFYDVLSFTVTSSQSHKAELTRPFAQLNIGTKDLNDYEAVAHVTVAKTAVTISQVYSAISLMDGSLTDPVENVTFTAAALPTGETFPVTYTTEGAAQAVSYTYLAMDYLLVSEDKALVEVTMTVEDDSKVLETKEYNNIPVQRNYRTNIYGALLTSQQEFNVEILPGFDGEYNNAILPWDGKTVTTPAIDESTKTVTVSSGDQLAGLAAYVLDNDLENYTVNLSGDIDMGGFEMPMIGSAARDGSALAAGDAAFKGVFDGGGNTIKNFTITNSGDANSATALFPAVSGKNAAVRNLNLENVTVSSTNSEQTAAAVGLLAGGATVENVNVLSGSVSGGKATAGVVSRVLSAGSVTKCSNAADVVATGANCGGVVGAAYYNNENGTAMSIDACSNSGNVTGTSVVGGVVGLSISKVSNCENTGVVTGNGASVGGVIGEQQNIGNITACVNSGDVTNLANAFATGGIVGWVRYNGAANIYTSKAPVVITDCRNSAIITSKGDAGGIVGTVYNYATVSGCTNTAAKINAGSFAAGIVANQQVDANFKIGDLDFMVTVKGNTSTTPIEDITGTYKNLFMYVNTPSAATVEDNNTTLD